MLDISRSGNMADVIASVRDVPARIVPYAASTALTRVAQWAVKTELPAEMRAAFGNPVSYTLNSLRIEPATKDALSARVMVKNSAAGVSPENFLFPQVEGGGRKHKRSEMAMRYAGVLGAAQFAMPASGMSLDANGNVKGAEVRTVLAALKNLRAVSSTRDKASGKRLAKGRKLASDLFVGKPNGGDRPDGIWRREGKRLRALYVFTNDAPTYSKRLDFNGVVQRVALQRFAPEFDAALAAMLARGGRA
jgi:hypothetical protein